MRKPLTLLLLAVLLAGSPALRGEEKPPEEPRLRKALERSLLFPGLGQLGEKQYVKAALFAAAEIVCLSLAVFMAARATTPTDDYRDATDPADGRGLAPRDRARDRRRNTAILAAAGVWVLNMIDIFVFAKKKYGGRAIVGLPPLSTTMKTKRSALAFACRF